MFIYRRFCRKSRDCRRALPFALRRAHHKRVTCKLRALLTCVDLLLRKWNYGGDGRRFDSILLKKGHLRRKRGHYAPATFDTFGYFEKLKAAGFSKAQAKAQAEVLREAIEDKVATKRDLQEVKRDMLEIEGRLKAEIANSRAETIKWVAGMLVAQAAVIAALVKLL